MNSVYMTYCSSWTAYNIVTAKHFINVQDLLRSISHPLNHQLPAGQFRNQLSGQGNIIFFGKPTKKWFVQIETKKMGEHAAFFKI